MVKTVANPLNYEASVPISERAPFSVKVDPNKPPGDRFKDFIPKNVAIPTVKADDSVKRKNFMRAPVSRYETDYIAPEESASKRQTEKAQIIEIAKELYGNQAAKRETYKQAEKFLESTDGNEHSTEAERARKIIARGKPLTKQEALEQATKQFYGLRV